MAFNFSLRSFLLTFTVVEGFYYTGMYIILHLIPSSACFSTVCFSFESLVMLRPLFFNLQFLAINILLAFFAGFVRIGVYEVFKGGEKVKRFRANTVFYVYYFFTAIMFIIAVWTRSAEFLAIAFMGLVLVIVVVMREKERKEMERLRKLVNLAKEKEEALRKL